MSAFSLSATVNDLFAGIPAGTPPPGWRRGRLPRRSGSCVARYCLSCIPGYNDRSVSLALGLYRMAMMLARSDSSMVLKCTHIRPVSLGGSGDMFSLISVRKASVPSEPAISLQKLKSSFPGGKRRGFQQHIHGVAGIAAQDLRFGEFFAYLLLVVRIAQQGTGSGYIQLFPGFPSVCLAFGMEFIGCKACRKLASLPSLRMAFTDRRCSRVLPYTTELEPQELFPTMPPIIARLAVDVSGRNKSRRV